MGTMSHPCQMHINELCQEDCGGNDEHQSHTDRVQYYMYINVIHPSTETFYFRDWRILWCFLHSIGLKRFSRTNSDSVRCLMTNASQSTHEESEKD